MADTRIWLGMGRLETVSELNLYIIRCEVKQQYKVSHTRKGEKVNTLGIVENNILI
jgi:hypothetical protein